jgi:hypothetical protein
MMLSQELARAAAAVSYLHPAQMKLRQRMLSLAASQLARFDIARPLVLVNGSEKGNESLFLLRQQEKAGGRTLIANPGEIEPRNGDLYVGDLKVDQLILELTRQELLAIDSEVLDILIHHCEYFNDVRTQLLVHDKRLLSVLGDRNLMIDFLGATEAKILSDHLLPGFGLHNESQYNRVVNHKDEWVIKPVSSGRGVGLHIGHQTDAETWRELLSNNCQEYMAQAYIESMRLEVAVPGGDNLNPTSMGLVGSLPCFDGLAFGPGFFRASKGPMIAGTGDFMFAGLVAKP